MLLLTLFGCGDVSDQEIALLLDANKSILENVEARLDTIETKVSARHGQGDGEYLYEGVLAADGAWESGTVAVTGSGASWQQGAIVFSTVELTYFEVDVDGFVQDGLVEAELGITIADGGVTVLYSVVGEVEMSGAGSGTAQMDWNMAASSAVDGGAPRFEGTVDDKDVASVD